MKLPEEFLRAAKPLIDELKSMVSDIEKSRPYTKNHYGRYLAIISSCQDRSSNGDPKMFALLLIGAGANVEGVKSAMKALNLV